jgi:4-aminobutyrate aminotransferase-like enzyme
MGHWRPGTHTSTFLGNAVNLAAGRAAIDVMRSDRLWERSERLGGAVHTVLLADLADSPQIGEIRGLGLFIGAEVVTDRDTRAPDPERATRIRRAAFERGVLVGIAGHYENVLKICPPLTIDERLLESAVGILIESIKGDR